MRNNIEETFFEIFNIKPKYIHCPADYYGYKCDKSNWDDADCPCDQEVYPQITSDILLKLMCLVVYCIDFRSCKTPEDIRDLILSTLIYNKDYIDKSKVQSLFTEVGESIHNGDEKLNKTLQEIKTIAENEIKELTDSAINGGRYLEILNLIKEAEGE